jgi:hypothetical protein
MCADRKPKRLPSRKKLNSMIEAIDPESGICLPVDPLPIRLKDFDLPRLILSHGMQHKRIPTDFDPEQADGGDLTPADPRACAQIEKFLTVIANGGRHRVAEATASVSWAVFNSYKANYPAVFALYSLCREMGDEIRSAERLDAMHDRAVNGTLEPIYNSGRLVGFKRVYSDKLLEVLVAGDFPKYRRTSKHEHVHEAGDTLSQLVKELQQDPGNRFDPVARAKTIDAESVENGTVSTQDRDQDGNPPANAMVKA